MKNFEIRRNEQANGIEIYFSCKPSESVRDALKGAGFRWHGVKKCWYSGRVDAQTAEKLIEGAGIGEIKTNEAPEEETKTTKNGTKPESLWNRCSVADLPAYGTDNDLKKPLMQAGKSYDKAVAEFVRKHLRRRFPECVFSVRSGGAGYLDAVRVSLKSCPYGRQLVKGDPEAQRDRDRWDHWENSAELDAVLNYCQKLLEAFDADDGDYYADYGAHHDLYFTVEVYSYDFTQTAATAEILADIEDFRKCKAEAEAREEKEQMERWKKAEEERQEREKMAQIAEEKQRRECAEVEASAIVEDLPEEKQIAFCGMVGGYGKENTVEEAKQSAKENTAMHNIVVSRRVTLSGEAFGLFSKNLLCDFSFLEGFGGSSTEDVRIRSEEDYRRLDREQLSGVSFFLSNCVSVYVGNELKMVIDPEGYNYARYCYFATERTKTQNATEFRENERRISEGKEPFYIPEPISRQIENAKVTPGEDVSVLRLDGFSSSVSLEGGKLEELTPTRYAQHRDAGLLAFLPKGGRRTRKVYFYGNDTAIFKGSLPEIPDELKYSDCGTRGSALFRRVNFAGEGAREFLKKAIKWYIGQGFEPVLDTVQR